MKACGGERSGGLEVDGGRDERCGGVVLCESLARRIALACRSSYNPSPKRHPLSSSLARSLLCTLDASSHAACAFLAASPIRMSGRVSSTLCGRYFLSFFLSFLSSLGGASAASMHALLPSSLTSHRPCSSESLPLHLSSGNPIVVHNHRQLCFGRVPKNPNALPFGYFCRGSSWYRSPSVRRST